MNYLKEVEVKISWRTFIEKVLEIQESRIFSESRIIETQRGRAVKKKYADISSVKWFTIGSLFIDQYPFVLNGEERMKREINFFRADHFGVKTPVIFDYDEKGKWLLREFIDGKQVKPYEMKDLKLWGQSLRALHQEGWTLGDTKYNNFIISRNDVVYLIDAEQSMKESNLRLVTWDIAVCLFFIALFSFTSQSDFRKNSSIFLESYLRGSKLKREEAEEVMKKKITLILPLTHRRALRSLLGL
jgi:tRNA A-37 threonylcarbamoyl transferase component Bud32